MKMHQENNGFSPIAIVLETKEDAEYEMANGKPFAACYWDTPKGRVFSLRSSDDGADVSEVAKQYGGGGHRNASGFTVSFAQAQAFELLTHNA